MKVSGNTQTVKSFAFKALFAAVAAYTASPHQALGAPTGGVVVDGTGSISQTGADTRIDQATDRLSLEWESFNVGRSERVQFVQPSASAVALNRILDNSGSQILGRIDANGHVILMNPNGVFFGRDAVVNVGGLVASGLNIDSGDFMNGDLVFSGLEGTAGTVINRGIINAAAGGNIALVGKSVANHGLISANLGHIALAAGSEAVVTFDDEGLIGVRIDRETLASEVGGTYAATNTGTIESKGGKILLNASVSADLFSEAVNHGGMNGSTAAVVHSDGSFSLGSGNNVVNTGVVNVSTDSDADADAGYVVLAGQNVEQRGTVRANSAGENLAGQIYLAAREQVKMTAASNIEANAEVTSGKISVSSDTVASSIGAKTATSGNTLFSSYGTLKLPELVTNHLYIANIGATRQVGAATVYGNFHLAGIAGADARLTNAGNDFNTFSLDAGYTSNTQITESNDITLNDLSIGDSSLSITALGRGAMIKQNAGTQIDVLESSLKLTADHILLGEGGSATDVYNGLFHLTFGQSVATNGSVTLHEYGGGIYANNARILAKDLEYGNIFLDLRGDGAIDLNADISNTQGIADLAIEKMTGKNATLTGYSETTQTGPITLSGTLTWNSETAFLTNPENDINSIQGTGGPAFGVLRYVDKNDLLIRNLVTGEEVSIALSSVGEGATLRQAANTALKTDYLELKADNIILGANGRSEVVGGYQFNIEFSDQLQINGPWMLYQYSNQGPFFRIKGDDGDNRLVFGEHSTNGFFNDVGFSATINISLYGGNDTAIFNSEFPVDNDPNDYSSFKLDMGDGNDRVYINRSVYLPLVLGAGNDLVRIWDMETHYEATDFDSGEDVVIVYNP